VGCRAPKKRGARHFTALVLADNLASLAMVRAVGRLRGASTVGTPST
jgi:hypothetical protein